MSPPYTYLWDTTLRTNGAYTLQARVYDAAGNSATDSRAVTVYNAQIAPVPCTYTVAPATQNIPASGGSGSVSVTTGAGCKWTALASPWIEITGGATGTGIGSVKYAVASNSGAGKSGALTVAGQQVTITQAATPIPPSSSASFVKADPTTQGNWKGVYGLDGYAIANDATSYPTYAQVSLRNQQPHTWLASTSDVRAVQSASGRIASTWYSFTDFDIDVNLTDGKIHQVSLYALDWDYGGARTERIDVLDATTNAVLDSRTTSRLNQGEYLVWNLSGHVVLRVTLTGGPNAVISGLFFSAPTNSSASFVKADPNTQGNWKGAYGSDGYVIANDVISSPAYAQVSFPHQLLDLVAGD